MSAGEGMNRSIRTSGSLLERAAAKYDFAALQRAANDEPEAVAEAPREAFRQAPDERTWAAPARLEVTRPAPTPRLGGAERAVDRARLHERGFILPDARPGKLAEEFRIIKRQLLIAAAGQGGRAIANGRMILVASANPDEGKTFCSVNLALSMAREPELDVVLVDGDFSKPEIVRTFGLEDGPGLIDALADPMVDIEGCVIRTDLPNLSILPAGTRRDDTTELLASSRTREVLGRLLGGGTRIVIFDSPPALSASPASGLALHAGQTVVVVKADRTSEAELREALSLLDGCDRIQLLLNGASFAASGRRFGSYYGYGDK